MPPNTSRPRRIRVRCWRNECVVAADHPAPERVRDHLDKSVRIGLAPALAGFFRHDDVGRDEGLVFIRRLSFQVTVNAAWEREEVARACSRALIMELVRTIEEAGADVVRFRTRAEYVGSYIANRAQGDGARAWFFARFDGLALVPPSAAIRCALCDDPAVGLGSLRTLTPRALAAVATALNRDDAALIVQALTSRNQDRESNRAVTAILDVCAADPPTGATLDSGGFPVWLLAKAPDDVPPLALLSAARIIRRSHDAARAGDGSFVDALITAAGEAAGGVDGTAGRHRNRDEGLQRQVGPRPHPRSDETEARRVATRWGAPFLLLDDVAAVRLQELAGDWPPLEGVAADRVLSLLVVARCLGSDRWLHVVADPVWRELFGIAATVTVPAIALWLDGLGQQRLDAMRSTLAQSDESRDVACLVAPPVPHAPPAPLPREWDRACAMAAAETLRRFAGRLPGFAGSGFEYLRRNFLDVEATVEFRADRIAVTLTRAPLDLVLALAGRNFGNRSWPWLDPRPFVLFTGE